MDDSKRKRDSSNSSTSSHLVYQKKAKEDLSDIANQTDHSVFSTPTPNMSSTSVPHCIQEESPGLNAHALRSSDSMVSSNASSKTSHSSFREMDEDRVITSAAELYVRLPEAKQVVRDMLRINTDNFQQSINTSVNSAIANEISMRNFFMRHPVNYFNWFLKIFMYF